MALWQVPALPESALDAAAQFHRECLPAIRAALAESHEGLTLVFPPADHTHREWRRAAVQGLAREQAPQRINAVEGTVEAAITAAAAYLASAEGLTGQVLPLDSHGAGPVV